MPAVAGDEDVPVDEQEDGVVAEVVVESWNHAEHAPQQQAAECQLLVTACGQPAHAVVEERQEEQEEEEQRVRGGVPPQRHADRQRAPLGERGE